jgi:hypothetical protein
MNQDRYDEIEARQRLYEKAARQYWRLLVGEEPSGEERAAAAQLAEEGRVPSADAGGRTPEEPPKEESAIEKFRDLLLYGPERS